MVTLLFVLDGVPGTVELFRVIRLRVITSNLNILFGIAGVGFRVKLGVGSVWWSGISSRGG